MGFDQPMDMEMDQFGATSDEELTLFKTFIDAKTIEFEEMDGE